MKSKESVRDPDKVLGGAKQSCESFRTRGSDSPRVWAKHPVTMFGEQEPTQAGALLAPLAALAREKLLKLSSNESDQSLRPLVLLLYESAKGLKSGFEVHFQDLLDFGDLELGKLSLTSAVPTNSVSGLCGPLLASLSPSLSLSRPSIH